MPLGWNCRNSVGFHTIFTGGGLAEHLLDGHVGHVALARGSQAAVERHLEAVGVGMALEEDLCRPLRPMVWLLDGPLPILNISLMDSMSGGEKYSLGMEENVRPGPRGRVRPGPCK